MLNYLKNLFIQKHKRKILVFCGADISAESGLNTFRDDNGIWTKNNINELCNLKTFDMNKEEVFAFYNQRKQEMVKAKPNSAHFCLAALQKKYGTQYVQIFTSNIDNLLEDAGCKNVLHVHGTINDMKCLDCNHHWHIGEKAYDINETCPSCNSSRIKPSIIFFNEYAAQYKELHQAFESSGDIYKNQIIPHIKLFIGTSFKVNKIDMLRPKNAHSILLDKNDISGIDYNDFEKIIKLPATQGIKEAMDYIEQIYYQ